MYKLHENEIPVKNELFGKTFNSVSEALFQQNKNGNKFFEIKDNQIFERNNSKLPLCKIKEEKFTQQRGKYKIKHQIYGDTIIRSSYGFGAFNKKFSDIEFFANFYKKTGYDILMSDTVASISGHTENGCLIIEDSEDKEELCYTYMLGIISESEIKILDTQIASEKEMDELEFKTAEYYIKKYGFKVKQK